MPVLPASKDYIRDLRVEVFMRKLACRAVFALLMLAGLGGCVTFAGRGKGPVDSFLLLSASNPGLTQNVQGTINELADPKDVELVIPPGTDRSTLIATLSLSTEAVISVVSSGTRVLQQNGVTANDFSAPVMYSIEVSGQKEPWRYRVVVREAEASAGLAQISLPSGAVIQPAFSPAVTRYAIQVPFATRTLHIEARAQSRTVKSISIAGVEYQGAAASASVGFATGQKETIVIETLAEDGVTRQKYTFLLSRAAPDSNAALDALDIQGASLAPLFTPSRFTYVVSVPFETRQLVVRARPQSPYAVLAIGVPGQTASQEGGGAVGAFRGNVSDKNGAVLDFASGARFPFIVTVTAQDGSAQQYAVEIVRAEPDHDYQLAVLSVDGGVLSPTFGPNIASFDASVPFATKQLTVHAEPRSAYARVALEMPASAAGAAAVGFSYQGSPADPTGVLLDFEKGNLLPMSVTVTAQDGNVFRYSLVIRRAPPDRNADLASLAVSAGALFPPFSPRVVSYSLALSAGVTNVQLTTMTASPRAVISLAGEQGAAPASSKTVTVAVDPGKSAIVSLVVTAEDGSQRLYQVTVSRDVSPVQPAVTPQPVEPANPAPVVPQVGKDGNTMLNTLQLAGVALQPVFSPGIIIYDAKIGAGVPSVLLMASAQSPKAAITVDGSPLEKTGRTVAVDPGATRVVAIDVTAENGSTARYTLRVSREEQPQPLRPQPMPVTPQPAQPRGSGL
jgi:hypothetical protein